MVPALLRIHWPIVLTALLAIGAHYVDGGQWLHWICKPLTTLLILAMAWRLGTPGRERTGIAVGLLCSTAGDIFLMLPGDHFVAGLLSFLLAHLVYLWAFTARAGLLARPAPYLLYALISGAILWLLWPGIPTPLRLPVTVYVVALSMMAAQAGVGWQLQRSRPALCAAIGGALFVLSDSLIAVNRFIAPIEASRAIILLSYWLAQWLIARSLASTMRTPAGPATQAA